MAGVLAFPWLPGLKRYPPWILVPVCYPVFFLLWRTLIFGGRGYVTGVRAARLYRGRLRQAQSQ